MGLSPPRRFSRRQFFCLAGGSLAALWLAHCSPAPEGDRPTPTASDRPTPTANPTFTPAAPDVGLEVKIGQMLLVGFRGLMVTADHPIVRDIRERHLGAVVLFDYDVALQSGERNIQSPAQVQALVADLQRYAGAPLLVAVDQEGGMISRLKEKYGFPPTVSHAYLGQKNDLALTHQKAGEMARTLAGLGINLNLAPVVDVNTNPSNPIIARYERSFSADPNVVTQQALEFIKAHHEQGVLCTLKHFPGHGSSTGDTHLGVVDVTQTWSRIELEPFANIIRAGQADAVMTAHVFNANLDPAYPATLSKPIITGILRGELGYDGVVISDDMQMGAITSQFGFETAVQKAIEAGVDLIAIANNLVYEEGIGARATALIQQLVQKGTIGEARIDQSYQRIRRLKSRLQGDLRR
jgi:beta-N-acetylhexosaminidase